MHLKELYEIMSAGTVHQFAGKDVKSLLSTDEFKMIQKEAPDFAKKLQVAWEGDAREYQRNKDRFDPLFPKMLEARSVAKFAPELKNFVKVLDMLKQLHLHSFPTSKAQFKDSGVWSHERLARESVEADLEYRELRAQVEKLLS